MKGHLAIRLKRYSVLAGLTIIALLCLGSTGYAQQTGTITGTVADVSKAVIPGAKVTLINEATKDSRPSVSNGDGFFAFSGVMPGNYSIKVEYKGFNSWILKGVNVLPGDKKNISNISMTVASAAAQVTVEATASEVQIVDSGERSSTLSSKDIKRLALQGRDVTELIRTLPGFNTQTSVSGYGTLGALANSASYNATETGIGSAIGSYASNGLAGNGQDLVSDGAHVIDPGCNCSATQTVNGDMVAEVKVQTSNFSAESPKGPVVINAVGKSGSAQYHGDVYFHARNSVMNSTDWHNGSLNVAKNPDYYYYPGASFGGPVRLPWTDFNRNNPKMFFWVGAESYRQFVPDGSGVLEALVPSMSMREGNFTATGDPQYAGRADGDNSSYCNTKSASNNANCTLAVANTYIPNPASPGTYMPITTAGILPSSSFDPGGLALLSMIPQPNTNPMSNTGGFNYINQIMQSHNGLMLHSRVDYNFSDYTKLNVSYNFQRETTYNPVGLSWEPPQSVPYPADMSQSPISHTITANLLHIFSPSLTNELIVTDSFFDTKDHYGNMNAVSRSARNYPYQGFFKTGSDLIPSISNGWWIPGIPMLYQGDASGYESKKKLPTIADNLTKLYGTHTIKAGVYFEKTGNLQGSQNYTQGQAQFSQWGNECLKAVYACQSATETPNLQVGTNNPTANLLTGFATWYTESNKNPVYDLAYTTLSVYLQDSWKLTKRVTVDYGARLEHIGAWHDNYLTGMSVWDSTKYATDINSSAVTYPGLRWHAIDASVPTSGRSVDAVFASPRFGIAWDVFGKGNTVLRGGWGAYRWRDSFNDAAGAMDPGFGVKTFSTSNGFYLKDIDTLSSSTGGSVSTATNVTAMDPKDHQQPMTRTYSFTIDQTLPGKTLLDVAYAGNETTHAPAYGNLTNRNLVPMGALFLPDPLTHTIPSDLANATLNDYRPFQGYGSISVYDHTYYSNYNALQATLSRRTGALNFGLNYTFSKTLGITGPNNPFKIDANYGVLGQDRTNAFNFNYSYMVGNAIHGANRLVRGIVNGWMISGITTLQSGPNLQDAYGGNMGMSITQLNAAGGTAQNITNRDIYGTDAMTLMPTVTCDPTKGLAAHQYVNENCFTVPSSATVNQSMILPYMRGPRFFNSDLSMQKTFNVSEKQSFEFRMAAFNFLNHPMWSFDPAQTSKLQLQMQEDQAGNRTFLSSNNWGMATTKYGHRVVELSVKYLF